MSNIGMTEDNIVMATIFNREAHNLVEQHVQKLYDQGILELGIKSDKLDDLMTKLRAAGILDGEYSFLDAAKEYLIRDFVADITRQIAANLVRAGGVTEENLTEKLAQYIDEIERPEEAQRLYLEVMNVPYMNFRICMEALQFAAYKPGADIGVINSLTKYLTRVIPVGTVHSEIPSKRWIMENRRKYIRIDFSPVIKAMPFAESYKHMFPDELVKRAGVSKSVIEGKAIDYLKVLILEDVFQVLTKEKDQTSPRINAQIASMAQDRFMYVCMRYIQAMAAVQADLVDNIRMLEAEKTIVETKPAYGYNGSFSNIPS